jgi:excisionase family DNA binding protein
MIRNTGSITGTVARSEPVLITGLLSTKEAARLLAIHHNTLCKWRIRGVGPRFVKAGHVIRYRRSDIEAWLQSRTYENTTEYTGRAKEQQPGRNLVPIGASRSRGG